MACRNKLTKGQIEESLRAAGWPSVLIPAMTALAWYESGNCSDATRVKTRFQQKTPEASYGLWQINTLVHDADPARLVADPVYNAQWALKIFKQQGFGAWFNSSKKIWGRIPHKNEIPGAANVLIPDVSGLDGTNSPFQFNPLSQAIDWFNSTVNRPILTSEQRFNQFYRATGGATNEVRWQIALAVAVILIILVWRG